MFFKFGHLLYCHLTIVVLLAKVNSNAIFIAENDSEETPEVEIEVLEKSNASARGLIDILENFRLWSIERRKDETTTIGAPTAEPEGLEAFIPKIDLPPIDENTLPLLVKGLVNTGQDLIKAFVGPPPTEPAPIVDTNGTNISTTIPPNTFFCFLC